MCPQNSARPRPPSRLIRRWTLPSALLLVAGLAIGPLACAPSEPRKAVSPARGQVFLEGKPAAGALVVFHPVDDPTPNALDPRAVVERDGTFILSTHNAHDGAPPVRYAVTVHDVRNATEEGGPPAAASRRIPTRYANPTTSGLEAQVRAHPDNAFTFRLTR